MAKIEKSKYNIGLSVAEGIYDDLSKAFNFLESGSFDKAFNKFSSIKGKIPSKKIKKKSKKTFCLLDRLYNVANKEKKNNIKYKIIIKYTEHLINELDSRGMYLPSLKDTSQFI